jgi:phytoene/squalene synthetase
MDVSQLIEEGEKQAESIVNNTSSHLCHAISYMNDKERVKAFNVMYAVMRTVDDIADGKQINGQAATQEGVIDELNRWIEMVEGAYSGVPIVSPLSLAFHRAIQNFPIPKRLWTSWFNSMMRDVDNPNFRNFEEFKQYSLGAACAPTMIYLFLTLSRKVDGVYTLNDFDYETAGFNLGLWAHLIHILRDARIDIENRLHYFPDEELHKHSLTRESLDEFLNSKEINDDFARFIEYYVEKANTYYQRSITTLENYSNDIEKSRQFSLLIVIRIYKAIEKNILEMKRDLFNRTNWLSRSDQEEIASTLTQELGLPIN